MKCDTRPPRGAWAPGYYMKACRQCFQCYAGDKDSSRCADCAYGNYVPERAKPPQVEAHERACKAIGDIDRDNRALLERINRLEEAGDEMATLFQHGVSQQPAIVERWRKAKEDKP